MRGNMSFSSVPTTNIKQKVENVISLDADGAVYHGCKDHKCGKCWNCTLGEEEPARTIKANNELFEFFKLIITNDLSSLWDGSNRQSNPIDATNSRNNQTPLFFLMLPHIAEEFERICKHKVTLQKGVLSDFFNNLPEGTNFNNQKLKHTNPWDQNKFTLLYIQIHQSRLKSQSKKIQFHFVDDKIEILDALHSFFQLNPQLIPKGLTLNLYQYKRGHILNIYEPIIGTGKPDFYCIKRMKALSELTKIYYDKKNRNKKPAEQELPDTITFMKNAYHGRVPNISLFDIYQVKDQRRRILFNEKNCSNEANLENTQSNNAKLGLDEKSSSASPSAFFPIVRPKKPNTVCTATIKDTNRKNLMDEILVDNGFQIIEQASTSTNTTPSSDVNGYELLLKSVKISQISESLDFIERVDYARDPHLAKLQQQTKADISKLKIGLLEYQVANLDTVYNWQTDLADKGAYSSTSSDSKRDENQNYKNKCLMLKHIIFTTKWDLWMSGWGGGTEVQDRDLKTNRITQVNTVSKNMVLMLREIQEGIMQQTQNEQYDPKNTDWAQVFRKVVAIGATASQNHHSLRKPQVKAFFNAFNNIRFDQGSESHNRTGARRVGR